MNWAYAVMTVMGVMAFLELGLLGWNDPRKVIWRHYTQKVEEICPSEGGGYRISYPALGGHVYGVGDTLNEAKKSLVKSQAVYQRFVWKNESYKIPAGDKL